MKEPKNLLAAIAATAPLLAGCHVFQNDAAVGVARDWDWATPTTYTTADVRMITQRPDPQFPTRQVICAEPTPDVAKAMSTLLELSLSGQGSGASGSLGAGASSAEAVMELAGRSTALLGLRDGLYRACEAYANGVIGADSYALVLSRYGQLMTTLFLGQDVTGAAGTAGGASAQSPVLNINLPTSGNTGTQQSQSSTQQGGSKSGNAGSSTAGSNLAATGLGGSSPASAAPRSGARGDPATPAGSNSCTADTPLGRFAS
jgi:hypothetical protein